MSFESAVRLPFSVGLYLGRHCSSPLRAWFVSRVFMLLICTIPPYSHTIAISFSHSGRSSYPSFSFTPSRPLQKALGLLGLLSLLGLHYLPIVFNLLPLLLYP